MFDRGTNKQNSIFLKSIVTEFPGGFSMLSIWHCYFSGLGCCCSTGLIPSLGTSAYCEHSPPKNKKKIKYSPYLTYCYDLIFQELKNKYIFMMFCSQLAFSNHLNYEGWLDENTTIIRNPHVLKIVH